MRTAEEPAALRLLDRLSPGRLTVAVGSFLLAPALTSFGSGLGRVVLLTVAIGTVVGFLAVGLGSLTLLVLLGRLTAVAVAGRLHLGRALVGGRWRRRGRRALRPGECWRRRRPSAASAATVRTSFLNVAS